MRLLKSSVALLAIAAFVGCSDSSSNNTSGTSASDAGGNDTGVSLGDVGKVDSGKVSDNGPPPDVPVEGCKSDADCANFPVKQCQAAVCDTATGQCMAATGSDGASCTPDDTCFLGACKAGACEKTQPVLCDDSNACTDDSCQGGVCQNKPNTSGCDDGDPNTVGDTCKDGTCQPGTANCPNTKELQCADKADDDCDGLVDCADNDCAASDACKVVKIELNCADGQDDDSDGQADCQDSDCANDVACLATGPETNCADGQDNDKDGKVDCADNDCGADPKCGQTVESNCADGQDDDKDGKIDCQDSDCNADKACVPATETSCTDKADNDMDGKIDCADNDCANDVGCVVKTETNCGDGVDEDKDGKADCADTDCAKDAKCAPGSAEVCDNKLDDDKDGKVDCNDADCAKDAKCATKCAHDLCTNGAKLDKACDPCVTAVCAKDSYCCDTAWDEVCVYKDVESYCGKQCAVETKCADKADDDKDGKIDCADADCAKDAACAAATTTCTSKGALACGASVDGNNAATGSTKALDTYTCKDGNASQETGSEFTYTLTSECDGPLTVSVLKKSTKSGYLDLFILPGGGACDPKACLARGLMGTDTAKATVTATKGQTFLVVVDGYSAYSSDFTLKVSCGCAAGKEVACGDKADNDADGQTDCKDADCAADAACAGETNCTDKVDDDKDGATDCADTDCAADAACKTPATEANCTDKIDEDKDGKTDCADTDCAANAACKETNCTDKADNDGDGKTDCADLDCAADAACKVPTVEANCTDAQDNDKDGKVDCADTDCATDAACIESNCTDKVDNDKDGKVDCLDTDCAKNAACIVPTTETSCTDKIDNDKDGKLDCADTDCNGKAGCVCVPDFILSTTDSWNNGGSGSTKLVNSYTCPDGTFANETGPEYVYSYTATCTGDLTITLTKSASASGFLDLFVLDPAKACGGSACTASALMAADAATKTLPVTLGQKLSIAVDGYQNFTGDYTIKVACVAKEANCTDKVDNDKDGKIDCADTDCAGNAACKETNCTDKLDNDADGKVDCLDSDCSSNAACQAPTTEVSCTDKLDNDKDGKIDCADTDCAKDAACVKTCSAAFPMSCGGQDTYGNSNFGSTQNINDYACKDGAVANETGPEYTYDMTATCDGDVTVTVKKSSTTAGFLDVFVLDGAQQCVGASCLAHALMGTDTAIVKFAAKKGAKYNVVVDGYNGYKGNYTITTSCACAAPPKEICNDKIDNDTDGKIDCADTDCAADPACAAVCKPDTDPAAQLGCGGADNWNNSGTGSTKSVDKYTCAGTTYDKEIGSEYVYTYTADCNGTATVKVTKSTDKTTTNFLDLFVLDGAKTCSGTTCLAGGLMSNGTAQVAFPVVKGSKYFVAVDGYVMADGKTGFSGDYSLNVTCACK